MTLGRMEQVVSKVEEIPFSSHLASRVLVVLCLLTAVTQSINQVLRWAKVWHSLQTTNGVAT